MRSPTENDRSVATKTPPAQMFFVTPAHEPAPLSKSNGDLESDAPRPSVVACPVVVGRRPVACEDTHEAPSWNLCGLLERAG